MFSNTDVIIMSTIKKIILLALTALMMVGCIEVKSKAQEEKEMLDIYSTFYYTPNGCEYYIYDNMHSGIPIHKQDCKVCKERRQKELEELLIKLKEK